MSEILVEMFRHNTWANERLFDACEGLNDTQLDATLVGTFGSIRDTLVHIAGAQERYVALLTGSGRSGTPRERRSFEGFAELKASVSSSSKALEDIAAQARPGDTVTAHYQGQEYTLPNWLPLVQAINHATEHRVQVAAILTQQGIEPPSMDGWNYHDNLTRST
jgi:uncharacterized damage-inducible protein DinB